jgi:hypothetical protein
MADDPVQQALTLLDEHYRAFYAARPFADATGHMVPCDTKSWSEILVSTLTGIKGRERQKGSDLADGSDVKGANTWCAIDTPRFNGVIPAGRTTAAAKKPADVSALNDMPYIFLALWDEMGAERLPRCRIWCVRAKQDPVFREMCQRWYQQRKDGTIRSNNFQLHPPRNQDHSIIRNTCGNLAYPLLFCAVRRTDQFELDVHDPSVLSSGVCSRA